MYEKNIELTRQLITDIKEKQSQGMALKNDITRYELQMESLKLGLAALHNNRSILNHQLCNTLGMNLEGQEVQIIPDTTVINKVYGKDGEAHWQIAGTMNSPLLEQSSNAIRIAEQKEKIAKSEMLPKVAFVAADNLTSGPGAILLARNIFTVSMACWNFPWRARHSAFVSIISCTVVP